MTKSFNYVKVAKETNTAGRPPDDVVIGGEKGRLVDTMHITPHVSEAVSDFSFEELRTSVERQFRSLADISRNVSLTLTKLKEEINNLNERVKKLEGGTVSGFWESSGNTLRPSAGFTTVSSGNFDASGNITVRGNTTLSGNTTVNGNLIVNGESITGRQLIIDDGHCQLSMKTGEGLKVKVDDTCSIELEGTTTLSGGTPIDDLKTYLENSKIEIDDHETRLKKLEEK